LLWEQYTVKGSTKKQSYFQDASTNTYMTLLQPQAQEMFLLEHFWIHQCPIIVFPSNPPENIFAAKY
jgi:hypothetical protein